jgi:hypothetical protein
MWSHSITEHFLIYYFYYQESYEIVLVLNSMSMMGGQLKHKTKNYLQRQH